MSSEPHTLETGRICAAIERRRLLRFTYDSRERLVEPYCHGWTRNKELVRAYQVGGLSASGSSTGWRVFRTDRVKNLVMEAPTFSGDREGREDVGYEIDEVHCRAQV